MASNIFLVILISSVATYISRLLGVISSENIREKSKIFRWFNCLAYSTLAALISRVIIFPNGDLSDTSYLVRIVVIIFAIFIYFYSKKNLVYPTVFSAIIMVIINSNFV